MVFTTLNRLVGLKCLEVHGLIDEVAITRVEYGGRSLFHLDFRHQHPDLAAQSDDALPADLVRQVLDKRITSIEQAGLDLVSQLPTSDDEECMTTGDPALLFNAFDALLDNVVRFSSDDGTIQVSLHESSDIIYIKIDRPGADIPAHHLLQIWQPQEQAGPSDPTDLAEVKQIVEQHGGHVWAESQPGQGEHFLRCVAQDDRPVRQKRCLRWNPFRLLGTA